MAPNTGQFDRKLPEIEDIPEEEKSENKINCVVVGDACVGKTSMVVSYTSNGYPEKYNPTVHDYYTGKFIVFFFAKNFNSMVNFFK